MALLWFDGFEGYETDTDLTAVSNPLIDSITYNGTVTIDSNGRRGSRSIYLSSYWENYRITFVNNYTSMIIGFATRGIQNDAPVYIANRPILDLYDGTTSQLRFYVVGTEIQVRKGDNTLLGTTSGLGFAYNTWRYLEFKFTIDNSVGSVVIRSNENEVINLSGIDTQNTANSYINSMFFRCVSWDTYDATARFDDFYICDTTGSKNNDFLGDVRVDVLRPDGAGTYTDFTPSAGANYENVDEEYGPDDDTTYNDGSNVGDQDTYALSDLEVLGTTIHGVKSQITVRKTDAGASDVKILTIAGTTEDLSDEIILSDSYITPTKIFEDNPDDLAAWEEADVNAMEVGVEITT